MAFLSMINKTSRRRSTWLIPIVVLLAFSCRKKDTDNGDVSEKFRVVLHNVTSVNNNRKLDEDQRYIETTFRSIKQPHVQDIFRYYGLKYTYYKKHTNDLKKELLYADSMVMTAKKSVTNKQYVSNYAEANFDLGDAYFDLSEFSNAYQCYYQGYFMGKNNLKNGILSEYTYRMGMVMFKQAHYAKAAGYFKLSFKQTLSYEDNFPAFNQRQELLANIGESYKNLGKIDSASIYYSKTLSYIDKYSNRFNDHYAFLESARAVVYGNQGEIAMIKGQYPLAVQLLQKSIAMNLKRGNDQSNAELVEINLGKLYLKNKQYQPFVTLFNDLRRQLDTVKNEEAETSWHWLMSKYYAQKAEPAKAYQHVLNYDSLKDVMVKRSSSLKETDVNQQQANYDKQYQIESLKAHNRLQLMYTYAAVTLAIMAVIIIALVLRNWKRSKRDIEVVNQLNQQVNTQKNDLEVTLNELKLSIQEKDRILRAVAHDLRNPIGGIASLTQIILLDDDLTDEQTEIINLIKESSNNSLELINEILEVAHSGLVVLNKERVEINSLISNSVELLRFRAAEKGQKIELELLKQPEELFISREKIWRVIGNLISNAIKFSNPGEAIYVKVAENQTMLQISIRDTGMGIPEKVKDKVFNMFTEAKRPGTAGEKSFGLGLSICKQIIESHDGKIWLESDGKTGTTFFINLPRLEQNVSSKEEI